MGENAPEGAGRSCGNTIRTEEARTTQRLHAMQIRAACVSDMPRSEHAVAGEVLDTHDGIHVACGSSEDGGVLRLLVLQRVGGKPLPAAEWLRGFALRAGAVLSAPPPS